MCDLYSFGRSAEGKLGKKANVLMIAAVAVSQSMWRNRCIAQQRKMRETKMKQKLCIPAKPIYDCNRK